MYTSSIIFTVSLALTATSASPENSSSVLNAYPTAASAGILATANVSVPLYAPTPILTPSATLNMDTNISADYASLAAEFAAFQTQIAKQNAELDALLKGQGQEIAENKALVDTNALMAQELSQAEKALANSKALADQTAKQAALDIENAKKSCTVVQKYSDLWRNLEKDAKTGSAVKIAQTTFHKYASPTFIDLTKEGTVLGCPAKQGAVCSKFKAVEQTINEEGQQLALDLDRSRLSNFKQEGNITPLQQQQSIRSSAGLRATQAIAAAIDDLKTTLGC